MNSEYHICIVIPCYNEEKRLPINDYRSFIETSPKVLLCFVNDGSHDGTLKALEELKGKYPEKVDVLSYSKNVGKAEAVQKGIQYCTSKYDFSTIAYLDADLSTSLSECVKLANNLNGQVEFCFGSRIRLVGTKIVRKKRRYLIGRIVATFISHTLRINVYDTQCGCKLFTKNLSTQLFNDPFISKWLFDVEIFFRMFVLYGREQAIKKMKEVPLSLWVDRGDSSVETTYFFKLWLDLYHIHKRYKTLP